MITEGATEDPIVSAKHVLGYVFNGPGDLWLSDDLAADKTVAFVLNHALTDGLLAFAARENGGARYTRPAASEPPKGDTISFKAEDLTVTDSPTEGYFHVDPPLSWEPTPQLRWFKTKMSGANLQQLWWERWTGKSEWRAVPLEVSE